MLDFLQAIALMKATPANAKERNKAAFMVLVGNMKLPLTSLQLVEIDHLFDQLAAMNILAAKSD